MKRSLLIVVIAIFLLWEGAFAAGPVETAAFTIAEYHKTNSVTCVSCHGENENAIATNEYCLACHGSYEELAERTKDMHINPHKTVHYYDLECAACHLEHKPETNFCQDCHGPISRH